MTPKGVAAAAKTLSELNSKDGTEPKASTLTELIYHLAVGLEKVYGNPPVSSAEEEKWHYDEVTNTYSKN